MYYLIQFYGKEELKENAQVLSQMSNNIVLDISFGSMGYGLIAARAFKQVHPP